MIKNFPKDTSHFKLLIADFDGTLVGQERILVSKVKNAIRKWEDSGRLFAIASGRQFLMLQQDMANFQLKSSTIARGGSEIVDSATKKVIHSSYIDEETIKRFVKIVSGKGYNVVIERDDAFYSNKPYFRREYPFFKYYTLTDFTGSAPKINVRVDDNDVASMEKFMFKDVIPKFPTLNIVRSYNTLGKAWDITSEKATKHLAVLELMKILNVKAKDTVGVGDGYNDYPLLTACGFKVAMGNANAELKELADVIVPSNEEDGVAYLIERLLFRKEV